jgi:hypothetical protein
MPARPRLPATDDMNTTDPPSAITFFFAHALPMASAPLTVGAKTDWMLSTL